MKKGIELTGTQYYLEIKDLKYKSVFQMAGLSLRDAVRRAGEQVISMDNYAKVYREIRNMKGVFVGSYFAPAKGKNKVRRVFVVIATYQAHNPIDEIILLDELDEVEKQIESGEIKTR